MNEIKNCPFCGGEIEIVRVGGGWFWRHKNRAEEAKSCTIQFNHKHDTKEKAIEEWNKREA